MDSAARLQQCLEDDLSFETYTSAGATELKQRWTDINQDSTEVDTTVDAERLNDLLTTVNTIPPSVRIHRKVQRIISQRLEMVKGNLPVDWALAEQAAYATLVQDGYRVRISGQDVMEHFHRRRFDRCTHEQSISPLPICLQQRGGVVSRTCGTNDAT